MQNKNLKFKIKKQAFTLIEILVAMAAFVIVVGAMLGLFVFGIQQQRRSLLAQTVLSQTSYALEFMSRALRMAEKELNAPACLSQNGLNYENYNGESGIKFINALETDQSYKCQSFYLNSEQLYYQRGTATAVALTSDKIEITSLEFRLSGQNQQDNLQPRVTILMEVKPKNFAQPRIRIQTTISQRNLDVKE